MKKLFICCTPFQVFNSIVIRRNMCAPNEHCDIAICNHFSTSGEIYERCRKIGIWEHCYHIKTEYKRNLLATMNIIKHNDFCRMIETGAEHFVWEYDEVFIGTFNNISSIIAYRYCKESGAKLNIFDEGIATYILQDFKEYFPKKQRILRKILGHVIHSKAVNAVFLYHPEWYVGVHPYTLLEIPQISRTDTHLIETLNAVFDYHEDNLRIPDIVYFDQPVQLHYSEFMDKLVSVLNAAVPNRFCIKWHPRTSEDTKGKYKEYEMNAYCLGGWELFLINCPEKTNRVYITLFSSAAILGDILLNDNDVVIMLYKIMGLSIGRMDQLIAIMQKKLPNVIVPQDWSEFESIIKPNAN